LSQLIGRTVASCHLALGDESDLCNSPPFVERASSV
jgi:hypothetical protein